MKTLEQISHAMLLPIMYIFFLCVTMEVMYREFGIQYDYDTLLYSGGVFLSVVALTGWFSVLLSALKGVKNES